MVRVGVGCGGPNAYSYRNISHLLFNLFIYLFFFGGGGGWGPDLLTSPTSMDTKFRNQENR